MEISVFPQWQIFLICLAWGIPCGLFYDLFRFLRKAGLNSRAAVVAEDIIFMCACAVWIFLIASALNFGMIRAYMIIAFFAGVAAYRLTVGRLTGRLFDAVISGATRVFRASKRVIKSVVSFFCKQTGKITVIFCSLHKNYREKFKNNLQVKTNRVYNYKKKKHSLIAGLTERRDKREGHGKRSRNRKKTEEKA